MMATNNYSQHQILWIGLMMMRIIDNDVDDDGDDKEIDSLSVPEK